MKNELDRFLASIIMQNGRKKPADDARHDSGVDVKTRPRIKRPNFYRVLLLNDDYTPMDFVVFILGKFFKKSQDDAVNIMLEVHHNGHGECGVFTYEIAESKVMQVMDCARANGHPLRCVMEKK